MRVRPVRATTDFAMPGQKFVRQGDLYRSDDPIVRKYPNQFEDVLALLDINVEKATRNPGQKRSVKPDADSPE